MALSLSVSVRTHLTATEASRTDFIPRRAPPANRVQRCRAIPPVCKSARANDPYVLLPDASLPGHGHYSGRFGGDDPTPPTLLPGSQHADSSSGSVHAFLWM